MIAHLEQSAQSADTKMAQYGMGLASSDRDATNRASFLFQLTGTVNNGEVVERGKHRDMILHDDFYKKFICRA